MKRNFARTIKSRSPYLYIFLGFLGFILAGCGLLCLPFATTDGISFIDALFVSTSAVCITGLSPVVLSTTFTAFGKVVICLLIQLGGLGFVTVAMFVFSLLGFKLGISDKFLVQETLGSTPHLDVKKLIVRVILISAIAETIGFFINLIAFRDDFSGGELVAVSAFHAVSAFNNAGFDIIGANSLIDHSDNVLLLVNTSLLTIVGGLGFIVINDVFTNLRWKKFCVHTKIVLAVTPALLLLGTLGFFFSEWGKIDLLNAFFMSAMTRTCGFASQNLGEWNNASLLLANFLMFVGAAPASTGGGSKCTTLFVILVALVAYVKGKPPAAFYRRFEPMTVFRALLIFLLSSILVFTAGTVICALQPDLLAIHVATETVSAFATVGLSAGITSSLTAASKAILCFVMFMGRIGLLTALMIFRKRWNRNEDESIRYVKAEILIG